MRFGTLFVHEKAPQKELIQDREPYARILGITDPSQVERIDLKLEIGEDHIVLGHASALVWPCPECGAMRALHEYQS